MARIHAWIARAGDLPFVPVPVATHDGKTLVSLGGRTWEIAPWMPGRAEIPGPLRDGKLVAALTGLASFHHEVGTDRSPGLSPGIAARAREIEGLLGGEFGRIARAIPPDPTDPRAILARRWVERAAPLAPGVLRSIRSAATCPLPLQPCLRDARPDHFLFEGDRLTGLVDFGAMGPECVAGDLARLFGAGGSRDHPGMVEAMSAYRAIRPLSDDEVAAIDSFLIANALLGAGRWARWHFLDRRNFDDREAVAQGLRRGLDLLDRCFPA